MWERVNIEGSLSDRIVDQIEQLIRNNSLRPGDRLPAEREMAQILGVSRPSLREAVRILEARGELAVRHGQGVFVQEPRSARELRSALAATEITLNELYAMREVLEIPAAAWAAERITASQLGQLRDKLSRMSELVDAPDGIDFDTLAKLDVEFHLGIAAAAGNRFLQQTNHVLHEMITAGMETTLAIPGRPQLSRRDHLRIYDALAAHDVGAARRAVRAHIRAAHATAKSRVSSTDTIPGPAGRPRGNLTYLTSMSQAGRRWLLFVLGPVFELHVRFGSGSWRGVPPGVPG